jgi:hypothetical protein
VIFPRCSCVSSDGSRDSNLSNISGKLAGTVELDPEK